MLRRHTTKSENRPSAFGRLIRAFVSLTFISVFVLSVTFGIKYLSEVSPGEQLATLTKSIPQNSKVGDVAGSLTKKLEENTIEVQEIDQLKQETSQESLQDIESNKIPDNTTTNDSVGSSAPAPANETNEDSVVSIFADSHSDISNLTKALNMSKDVKADAVIHLGDHTNLGIAEDLQNAYGALSSSGMTFYAVPGDRDLWKTSGPQNFESVFGDNKHTFSISGQKIIVFDNSMNFSNIPQEDMDWFLNEVADADFVFLSQPLFHPSNKVMGNFEGEEIVNVKKQANQMLEAIRQSNVNAVFAAEHHLSSETQDPQDPSLMHYVIGAITSTINDKPQSILQSPRFSILKINADGSFSVEEKVL